MDGARGPDQFRVRLLGTGSPRPSVERAGACVLVHAGDQYVCVDAGERALIRLMEHREPVREISTLLFTHLHSDHTLGYGHFVLGGWTLGRRRLKVLGPRGTIAHHVGLIGGVYAEDVAYRLGLGRDPTGLSDIDVREIGAGVVAEVGPLRIRAAWVVHQLPTLAYRFEFGGQAIVISGDTAPCDALVDLATGADVLIQDCCLDPDARSAMSGDPERARIWARIATEHCSPLQAGELAARAGVGRLVLTHFLLGHDPRQAVREATQAFAGEISAGTDGQQLVLA